MPVTQVLKDIGITDITIVPDQEYPNGYFTTCSYPNPEIFAALEQGLNLAKETGADLMLATDPDADRVGIAMKCPDGSYELVSGNEVGVLLLDYICAGRIEKGTMPENPVAVKSSFPHRLQMQWRSITAWSCGMSLPDSNGSATRSHSWKRRARLTALSSDSRRATDILRDRLCATKTQSSAPC